MKRQNQKLVMGFDPSSTICGWAAMRYDKSSLSAGTIRPDKLSKPSYERVFIIARDVEQLLNEYKPDIVLVEWTEGKVGRRRHTGFGAGLAVYGTGVGAVGLTIRNWTKNNPPAEMICVLENDWTRRIPKETRTAYIASEYAEYKLVSDPGGDIADAIGIINWYLKENLI